MIVYVINYTTRLQYTKKNPLSRKYSHHFFIFIYACVSFSYLCTLQARAVLERHLVIADKVFTMAELKSMGPDYIVLPTARDSLQVKVKEEEKRKCFFYFYFHMKRSLFILVLPLVDIIFHIVPKMITPFFIGMIVCVCGCFFFIIKLIFYGFSCVEKCSLVILYFLCGTTL